jgi:hypothetical protein
MQVKRVAAVTAALAALGVFVGAVSGALVMLAFVLVRTGFTSPADLASMIAWGAMIGAVMGAVLGPLSAWLLMRHVPIGIAIGGTALGTIAGAVAGLFLGGPGVILLCALGGFAVAAVALWLRTPRGTRPGAGARGPSA